MRGFSPPLTLAGRIRDMNIAAEANDIAEAEIREVGEQLVLAEAAIGKNSHAAAGRHHL